MKKYKGIRAVEDIKKDAENLGFEVDLIEWEKGSDWFYLRDVSNREVQIVVNCFGRFMVYKPYSERPIATELSEEFDDENWYLEILNLLYEK